MPPLPDPDPETPGLAQPTTLTLLPFPLPLCPNARIALFAMRRMGAHGLHDARAAHGFLTAFGRGFRRPLTLMRALMADLAETASGPIAIAPCCCARMTASEAALLRALALAETQAETAQVLLADLVGRWRADNLVAAAGAVAAAFADEGRPVT